MDAVERIVREAFTPFLFRLLLALRPFPSPVLGGLEKVKKRSSFVPKVICQHFRAKLDGLQHFRAYLVSLFTIHCFEDPMAMERLVVALMEHLMFLRTAAQNGKNLVFKDV